MKRAGETGRASSRPPLWRDARVRGIAAQLLVLALVVAAAAYLVHNTLLNLQRLGVQTGFGFLSQTAGFDISQTLIAYDRTWTYGRAFLVGLLNTFYVAIVGIVLATLVGFVAGIARLSSNWLVAKVAAAYVEVVRNVPLLLQLIVWYVVVLGGLPAPQNSLVLGEGIFLNVRGLFVPRPLPEEGFGGVLVAAIAAIALAIALARWARRRFEATGRGFPVFWTSLALLVGLPLLAFLLLGRPLSFDYPQLGKFRVTGGLVLLPEFLAMVLGLAIYTAAFIAEIVRAGILAVDRGQWEAAYALGLSTGQTLRLVVVPQAMRVIVPPQTSQYLNLTKNSSLGVAIAYPDFFNVAGTVANQTGQAVEVIAITMAVYLSLSLAISAFMNWYNARVKLVER
ncbi:putative glutamine ABC transporter permease protein GlnM [bacterium HR40]|nr:putative glutamine ABC transporter permease protein GlnM [bacterium HR40]